MLWLSQIALHAEALSVDAQLRVLTKVVTDRLHEERLSVDALLRVLSRSCYSTITSSAKIHGFPPAPRCQLGMTSKAG